MNIFVNSLIEYRNDNMDITSVERVLWISSNRTKAVTISLTEKNPKPRFQEVDQLEDDVQKGYSRKLDYDPYYVLMIPDEDLSEKKKELRDKAWNCIQEIVSIEPNIYMETERYQMVMDVCRKKRKSKSLLYKYLRNYWIGGKTLNALLPNFHKCGGKGKAKNPTGKKLGRPRRTIAVNPALKGINVDETIRKMFDQFIERYVIKGKKTVKFAYGQLLKEKFAVEFVDKGGISIPLIPPDHMLPSLYQFSNYYYKNYRAKNYKKTVIAKEGEKGYALKFRPSLGTSTRRANGPGAIYEIDATVADVYLVSAVDRAKIIGRPVVYIVIDVFSRMVTGMYVGLEGPSWQGAMMALENATTSKVQFCAEYGIQIAEEDWPCRFLPEAIIADRGEMESKNADSMIQGLNIPVKNEPPYRADLKGIVEQKFRTINIRLGPWMPGAVKEEYKIRGGPDYVYDAQLTLKAFTTMMLEMVIDHNNKRLIREYPGEKAMVHDKVLPIPINLWNWGIENRSGYLRELPRDIIRLNLMPTSQVTVTREGLTFKGLYYASKELIEDGWFIRGRKSLNVTICYDRRSVS